MSVLLRHTGGVSMTETMAVESIRHCHCCDGLSENEISRVAAACTFRDFATGETVAPAGDSVFALCIVTQGRLKLFRRQPGDEERFIGYINLGETVGQSSMLSSLIQDDLSIIADVSSRVAIIPRSRALRLIFEISNFRENLISSFGQRVEKIFEGRKLKRIPRIIGIVSDFTSRGGEFLKIVCDELRQLQETVAVFSDRSPKSSGLSEHSELACWLKPDSRDSFRQNIREQVDRTSRVVLDVSNQLELDSMDFVFRECDEIIWCADVSGATCDWGQMKELLLKHPDWKERIVVVQMLEAGRRLGLKTITCPDFAQRDFIIPASETDDRLYRQGIDRFIRHLRGVTIGLALGGGGARGMSHLGVMQVLERNGIGIDVMSGTSAGAMVGLGYAAGIPATKLTGDFASELQPPRLLERIPGGRRMYLVAKFRQRAWEKMLRNYYHDWTFEQLPIPFHVAVTDLVSGDPVIRSSGDIVEAILESINVPLLADPIMKNGQILVDGGVVNNLPVELLNEMGADFVIGVDASKEISATFAGNRPGMTTKQMKRPGRFETAQRVLDVSRRGVSRLQMDLADIVIEPDTSAFDFADFTSAGEISITGEAAAEQMLPELQRAYSELADRAIVQD